MANKGKNISKSNNTKKSTTTKSNSSSKKSPAKTVPGEINRKAEAENIFFKDSTKEIILWFSIAACILLLISNFGLGGFVGNHVASFLFGTFGLIQYILPVMMVLAAFFLISNYGNNVAVAKTIVAFVFFIFLATFFELFENGNEVAGPVASYYLSKENHLGGGFIGGGIAYWLVDWFALFGAYLLDLVVCIVCVIIIFEKYTYSKVQNTSRYHTDRAAERRLERREKQRLEREAAMTRYSSGRQQIQSKIQSDFDNEIKENENNAGPRRERKHSGITSNTTISMAEPDLGDDSVNEIRFNMGNHDLEITETAHHKINSNTKSSSLHEFKEDINDENISEGQEYIERVSEFKPVINMPGSSQMKELQVKAVEDTVPAKTDESLPVVKENMETTHRHAKPSVSSTEEIESAAQEVQKSFDQSAQKKKSVYKKPPLNLLSDEKNKNCDSQAYLQEMSLKLQKTLSNFGVEATVAEVTLGPSVTQYKISINEGTKVSKVLNLSDDIKLNMAVTDVRIEAPIPGEPYIGIEVPNKTKTMVRFRELVSHKNFTESKSKISFCVGKDIQGNVIVGNIEKMPHLLIAGATGSGKSVCINTIIMSILYHATPDEVKLIMVDPKMVELSVYNGIPHLLIPVVTDAKKAAGALHWAVKEMTDRYELLAKAGVRNIQNFNEKVEQDALPESVPEDKRTKMPQIVIILDELADLMMVAAADVEDSIVRLAQLARAAGIHLIIATQRPTSNVITGLIKANVPSRIAFSVSSAIDSRVILDMNGAEDLLGNGDMLYAPQNESKPIRIQGAFVSDQEVTNVVDFLKKNNDSASYSQTIEEEIQKSDSSNGSVTITGEIDDSRDSLFAEAGKLVIDSQKGSIGYLQRNFRIGFNRAARIMDQLAEAGVVGPEMGTKPREIRMNLSEFEEYLSNQK